MDTEKMAKSFSMPIGPGPMYGPPPFRYRGVEDLLVAYEAEPSTVEELLPAGVSPANETPVCLAWARWVPFSTFGPYHESYVMIRADFEGTTFLYQPFIFTDNEIALGAGREIWGYAKKLAVMERSWGGNGQPYGEQLLFTVERPRGKRIMTVNMACDELANPGELDDLPVLSTRLIPSAEAGNAPSVAELVRLDVEAHIHQSEDGTPQLWTGRATVTMDSPSAVDPWHLLRPTKILQGWFGRFDFDLHHGTVVHNYLNDGIW